jgi:hypothetical protein
MPMLVAGALRLRYDGCLDRLVGLPTGTSASLVDCWWSSSFLAARVD